MSAPSFAELTPAFRAAEPISGATLAALIKSGASTPSRSFAIFDVRNPDERAEGQIPTSVPVPLPELSEALQLSDEEFAAKYGAPKPTKETLIVTHCKGGTRSGKAMDAARALGYEWYASFYVCVSCEGFRRLTTTM